MDRFIAKSCIRLPPSSKCNERVRLPHPLPSAIPHPYAIQKGRDVTTAFETTSNNAHFGN